MTKTDIVALYLTKITQVHDELVVIREEDKEQEPVRITLNGFSKTWDAFVCGIVARENLPGWERLWDDFVQEEMRVGSKHVGQQQGDDEENVSLLEKGKKKSKKSHKSGVKSKGE